MRQLTAFIKKECREHYRSGKIWILAIVFVLFGIMNPAMAKLTPWMMEMASESLESSGLSLQATQVDALTSWTQFYKNVPMAMIIFLLMFAGIFTREYEKGTLINMLTKGLARWKVVLAKFLVEASIWGIGYLLMFGITYGYNAYFWDNSIAEHIGVGALCLFMFGLWVISLEVLISVMVTTTSSVTLFTVGIIGVLYFLSMIGKVKKFLPVQLLSAGELLMGSDNLGDYQMALILVVVLIVVQFMAAVLYFDRRGNL